MTGPAGDVPDREALYEEAACGLLVTAGDGTIERVNRTFCRWLGHSAEELVGRRRMQELLTMGGRLFHQTHWAPLLQMQGSVAEVKLEMLHRDGSTIPMMMNAVRREEQGRVRHELAIFVAEDRNKYERELLAARRRAEELLLQARQAQQALAQAQAELIRQRAVAEDRAIFAEQMVGIVSHDLRNPLSAIQMSAHLLGRSELSPNQMRVLGRLSHSTARANRLIADLLDFTQARLGRGLKVSPRPVDLHGLVSDCVDELALAFPAHRLEHARSGEGECMADADRLVQMVGNLVANAVAYGAPGKAVRVSTRIGDEGCAIAVHNHGEPVDPDLLPQLFEPMIRGPGSAAAKQGVGLGLFIVREIVRAHGGSVSVDSSAEAGTCVVARLPRSAPAADAGRPGPAMAT